MNKEKDFFKTCFNIVAGLEVKNESQAIAKEVVLSEVEKLQQENKQLKEQLFVTQTNAETFKLEMEDVTKTLGLDENTLFDDVKVYARSLKDNWNKLKEHLKEKIADGRSNEHLWLMGCYDEDKLILEKMEELERGSDSDE